MDDRHPDDYEEILSLLAGGFALRKALEEVGVARVMFARRIAKDEAYRSRYLDAKRAGILMELEAIGDLFADTRDKLESGKVEPDLAKAFVQNTRNEVDAIRWKLSKLVPKVFGDQVQALPQAPTTSLMIDLSSDGDG